MDLEKSLAPIQMLVLDVDGVMTDSRIWLDTDGQWKRQFSVRDGVGLKRIMDAGYKVAIITGGSSVDVRTRAEYLGVDLFYEGAADKTGPFEDLLEKTKVRPEQVAYVGDDVFDIPIIERVGFGATVPGGVEQVQSAAQYTTTERGGYGAVREICELILKFGYHNS